MIMMKLTEWSFASDQSSHRSSGCFGFVSTSLRWIYPEAHFREHFFGRRGIRGVFAGKEFIGTRNLKYFEFIYLYLTCNSSRFFLELAQLSIASWRFLIISCVIWSRTCVCISRRTLWSRMNCSETFCAAADNLSSTSTRIASLRWNRKERSERIVRGRNGQHGNGLWILCAFSIEGFLLSSCRSLIFRFIFYWAKKKRKTSNSIIKFSFSFSRRKNGCNMQSGLFSVNDSSRHRNCRSFVWSDELFLFLRLYFHAIVHRLYKYIL